MRPDDFVDKWAREARAMQQRGALVQGAGLLDEILRDFEAVMRDCWDEPLNLTEAAAESGYSADYLGRLVKDGSIPNAGRPNAPRIRRANLPRKAGSLRPPQGSGQLPAASPGQIARAVVTSKAGERR
jgi:hypothetical protein